jgi:carbamate kinase
MSPKIRYGFNGKLAVLALGGNAIHRKDENGNIHRQFANTRRTARLIMKLILRGYRLVITHGNGPQVGDRLIQVEAALDRVADIPLGVLVGDTQGGMGYMIEQCIHNVMRREFHMSRPYVATVLTQVLVDADDPSIGNPSKPIGPFYTREQAERLIRAHGWAMSEETGRGWRRVVPSPVPIGIVERATIMALLKGKFLVIAAGGGGIPVYREKDGWLEGVDAVVDKDRASAILADVIDADELFILTDVDAVALHFKTPQQHSLSEVRVGELERYRQEGHFPDGTMGPKVEAAIHFLSAEGHPGRRVLITSPDATEQALEGAKGTWVLPDPQPGSRAAV